MTATTGHPLGDTLLPHCLTLVGAVRRQDRRAAHEAIAAAHQAARDRYWVTALVYTLAALVPDDRPVSELLAWVEEA